MKVRASSDIAATADSVWGTVRDFDGLTRWAPGIIECTMTGFGVGALRTIKTRDGMKIVERLESYDEAARSFSYSIVEGPIPVRNYLSRVAVTENGGNCTVLWETSGEPTDGFPEDQLEQILTGVCGGSVKALKAHCELQGTAQMRKYEPEDL